MADRIDAMCAECSATFPREEATAGSDQTLVCPVCGGTPVRGIPDQHHDRFGTANTRCGACGSTFARSNATTDVKGVLACPVCGSTSDLELNADEDG